MSYRDDVGCIGKFVSNTGMSSSSSSSSSSFRYRTNMSTGRKKMEHVCRIDPWFF